MATYRGKYPSRIKSISIGTPFAGATVITNDGTRYQVFPSNAHGSRAVPEYGRDISEYTRSPDYRVTAPNGDVIDY